MNDTLNLQYITYDAWWDTDSTVLEGMSKHFNVNVQVINHKGELKFKEKNISGINSVKEYNSKYKHWCLPRILESISFFFKILSNIKKNDYVLYVNGSDVIFRLLFLIFVNKKRVFITIHNYQEHGDNSRANINSILAFLFYRKFKYFHFFSEEQCNLFSKDFNHKTAFFSEMPLKNFGTAPTTKHNKRIFLFFGFLRKYKNPELFIEAANRFANDAIFYIAGTCDNWSYYDSLIDNKGQYILDIRFIDNDEIPKIFSMASFLVLPYSDTTQSGPSLIAINYGVPIIASNLEGFRQIIHNGENGILFDHNNKESFFAAIHDAINMDEETFEDMKQKQLEFKNRYTQKASLSDKLFEVIVSN
jgi:glycosyltransferase involved in cell wall biosynthesis